MTFNRETWYSKAIAIFLFFAFPIATFYLGVKYQKSIIYKVKSTISSYQVPVKSKVTFEKNYENNLLKYAGTVEVPSPCHEIRQETKIMESFPEQIRLDLTVEKPAPGNVCAQQITLKNFSGELKVSENASVSVFLDGQKVY